MLLVGRPQHRGGMRDMRDQVGHLALRGGHRRDQARAAGALRERDVEAHVGEPVVRVFAGLALDGTVISINDDADAAFYKKPGVAASDILAGQVTSDDDAARRFMAAVATSTGMQRSASAAGSAPATPAPAGTPAPAAPPPAAAQSFPLSDPQPGSQPK